MNNTGIDNKSDFYEFAYGYMQAALWSSTDDYGKPFDRLGYLYNADDFSPEAWRTIEDDCRKFLAIPDITELLGHQSIRRSGFYFWLTRNHHGDGIWPGGGCTDQARRQLTELSQSFGTCYPHSGKDGMLHFSNH